jgi:serine/threonine protein kinase
MAPSDSSQEPRTGPGEAFSADIFGLPSRPADQTGAGQSELEVLAEQFLVQLRAGRHPSIEDYVRRHPHLDQDIRRLFPMMATLESWKLNKETSLFEEFVPRIERLGQLGGYRCFREIGRGGMGIVYEAVHIATGRQAALKVLKWRVGRDSDWQRRFEREARTASQLRHPNIVPVYEFGESEGFYYYVMPLVDGVSLEAIIQRLRESEGIVYADEIRRFQDARRETGASRGAAAGSGSAASQAAAAPARPATAHDASQRSLDRSSWRQIAKIGVQVAQALNFAHRQRVLHRDIKPANLLLDAGGVVWITDFGLARSVDEQSGPQSSDAAGTLRYMAPEQLRGQVDARSDVYSLGITMYELVTLALPFETDDRGELLQRIADGRLAPPRELNPQVPDSLDLIVRTAAARVPEERYQSAADLASDLLRFANARPVGGGRGRTRKAWSWLRGRRPGR